MKRDTSSRGWCFTINNYTEDDLLSIFNFYAQYLVFAFEVGEKCGTPHVQGYCRFKSAKLFSTMQNHMPRANLTMAEGTAAQNRVYIVGPYEKDGKSKSYNPDHLEFGECPENGKISRERLEQVMANPFDNFHLYNQYRKAYKEIVNNRKKDHVRKLRMVSTEFMYDKAEKYETVCFDNTFETYDGEDCVIIGCYGNGPMINQWYRGYPPKIRRGYELIMVDPQVIYLTYTDAAERAYILKHYPMVISKDCSELL